MSYCNPTHVSDYVWNRVLNYIETISGWARLGAAGGGPGRRLAARRAQRARRGRGGITWPGI